MRWDGKPMNRRAFLWQTAAAGATCWLSPTASAASRERVVVFQGVGLNSLHPYAYSGGGISGIWQHVIEPLIEMDYARKEYTGVLAESWEFQGRKWVFRLRKNVRFHDGAPFTSKDVAFSFDRMVNDRRSLQASNFLEITAIETPDEHTVVISTKQPSAVLLERLNNRFIVSQAAVEKNNNQLDDYKPAPVLTKSPAGSVTACWCSRAMTTIGAPNRKSGKRSSKPSRKRRPAFPGCSPARPM